MLNLVVALSLVTLALLIHVAWWRWRLPRHHTRALILAFSLPPCLALGIWLGTGISLGVTLPDLLAIMLFYVAATGCYLITYAGVEATSPSLVIMRTLEKAGPRGCAHAELKPCITEELFITPRLVALQEDGLIVRPSAEGAKLTPAGHRLARFATFLAKLFNLHEGA